MNQNNNYTLSSNSILRAATALILVLGFWYVYTYQPAYVMRWIIIGIGILAAISEWIPLMQPHPWNRVVLFSLVYLLIPIITLLLLNETPAYRIFLVYICITVAAFDTGSYIAGKLFGHHTIAPTISPNKTWQGFFGGLILTYIVVFACNHYTNTFTLADIIIFTPLICIIAFMGDLFESGLKRTVGVKDSGFLLPGHGGILDRIDGILSVSGAVAVYYALWTWLR